MLDSARILVSVDIGNLILMCDQVGLTVDDHRQLCERLQRLKELGAINRIVSVTLELGGNGK